MIPCLPQGLLTLQQGAEEFKFDIRGEDAGGAEAHFRCTAYFPTQFHALRKHYCGGDDTFNVGVPDLNSHAARATKLAPPCRCL